MIHFGTEVVDFYDIKAAAETVLKDLRRFDVEMVETDKLPEYVEKGNYLALQKGKELLGGFGLLLPGCLKSFGIKVPVYFLEINLSRLEKIEPALKSFTTLARFPSVNWDLAVLVPEGVAGGEIVAAVNGLGEKIVEKVEIIDVFRGDSIEKGYKSVAISVDYRDQEKTLEDDDVQKVHQKIIDLISTRFGGKLREA